MAPEGTWVLRGGLFSAASREKNLRRVHDEYGLWGICVAAQPGCTVDQIAQYGTFGNEFMLTALSEELANDADALVVVEPGRDWPHALLAFAEEPDLPDWEAVVNVFSRRDSQPNPSFKGPKDD